MLPRIHGSRATHHAARWLRRSTGCWRACAAASTPLRLVQGIALAIAWLGAAFWITLVFDWWVEPPVLVRQIMIGLVAVVLRLSDLSLHSAAGVRAGWRTQIWPCSSSGGFKTFGESLVTTVELADHPDHADRLQSANAGPHAERRACGMSPTCGWPTCSALGPLVRRARGRGRWPSLSVGAFAIGRRGAFDIWVKRELLFSEILWPRRTHLAIEGFADKRIKVAKGSDVTIVAKADTQFEVPETDANPLSHRGGQAAARA